MRFGNTSFEGDRPLDGGGVDLGGLAEVVSSPRYSTGVGLLLAGLEQHRHDELVKLQTGSFQHVFERMRSWVAGNF